MKNLIVILFITAIMLSCEKDDSESKYPESYYTKLVIDEVYRVFTSEGEMKDGTIKNLVVTRSKVALPSLANIRQKEDICATILNEEKVFFVKGSNIADTCSIVTIGSLTFWEKDETTNYYPSIQNEFNKTLNYTDTSLFVYKPIYYKEISTPLSTGYSMKIEQRTCFYVEKDGSELIMPFVDYCLLTDMGYQNPNPHFFTYLAINNRVKENPNFIIAQKDTLIIREYVQRLTKESIPESKKSIELTIYNANSWSANSSTLSVEFQTSIKLFKIIGSSVQNKASYTEHSDENGIVNFYDIESGNYMLVASKDDLSNIKDGLLINGVYMNAEDTIYTTDKPYQENPKIGGFKFKDINQDGVISDLDITAGDNIEVERTKLLIRDIYVGR